MFSVSIYTTHLLKINTCIYLLFLFGMKHNKDINEKLHCFTFGKLYVFCSLYFNLGFEVVWEFEGTRFQILA